jgi:predicted peptidase
MLGKMIMLKTMTAAALLCGCAVWADPASADDGGDFPEPGKQVLRSIRVPASQSFWTTGNVDQLGEYLSADTSKEENLFYWLFLPTDESAKSEKGFPLLLFLHGAGERGNPEAVKVHGPPKLVETEKGVSWVFITVSPSCPENGYWSVDQLLILIDRLTAELPVDPDRIYVTGLSMGGYGTWMLLDKAGERFAAAAPLCGGYDPAKASVMLDIPVWMFHGDADGAVPVARSIDMAAALRKLGGENFRFTLYPGVGHDCWTVTYDNPELYTWFLSHSR